MKLGQSAVIHVGRRRHHQIFSLAVHREQDDLADVRLIGDQHHHAVDAGRDAAVRRCLKDSSEIGNFILPIGAIRGDGTSNDYFPPEVPALPSFKLHKFVSDIIVEKNSDYRNM